MCSLAHTLTQVPEITLLNSPFRYRTIDTTSEHQTIACTWVQNLDATPARATR